jgi:DHA1 family multidrug resistance protein-like MFS transporter
MIVFGGLLVAGGMILFMRANSPADLVVASVLFGLGGGISMPAHMAVAVFKGNQSDAMGSLMGLMTMAHSLGMLMGSSLAGLLMDIADLRDAFSLGALISFSGVLIFFMFTHPGSRHLHKKDVL